MNIPRLMLVGCVALTGALLAPAAQARDHDRDDHRDRHEFQHHHHGDFDRPYYYGYGRRPVVYNEAYYTDPGSSITIAVGGHRHRHWHR